MTSDNTGFMPPNVPNNKEEDPNPSDFEMCGRLRAFVDGCVGAEVDHGVMRLDLAQWALKHVSWGEEGDVAESNRGFGGGTKTP